MTQGVASVLLEALQALYHHPEQAVKDAASRWLEDFQQVCIRLSHCTIAECALLRMKPINWVHRTEGQE